MVSQDDLKAQLHELMNLPENMHCVDCGDRRPTWASLIVPPKSVAFADPIGCFCCYHCSGAHRRMGTHICFVRSTNLDEWKEKELEAMKKGGNMLINKIFEGKLSRKERASVKPDKHTELDPRSNYIYDKYQHRKWFDLKIAQDKSNFDKPADRRESFGEFDAFLALRTKDAASDDWHEDGEGDQLSTSNRKQNVSNASGHDSARSIRSAIPGKTTPFEPELPVGSLAVPRSVPDPRVEVLNRTLQRMDSKREVLQTIRGFEKDDADQNLSPRKVKQTIARTTDTSTSLGRRSGGTPDKTNPQRVRRNNSGESDKRRGGGLSRTKSSSRDDSDSNDRRRGVSRSSSDDSSGLTESSSQKPSSRDLKDTNTRISGLGGRNEPNYVSADQSSVSKSSRSRVVERTKSMDDEDDSNHSRRRSKSAKRSVRRTQSSNETNVLVGGDVSSRSFDGSISQASVRSGTRRPRRVPRDGNGDGVEDEDAPKPSSRRLRNTEESSRTRSSKDARSTGSRSRSRPRKPSSSSMLK